MKQVRDALSNGWRLTQVDIEFGDSQPLTPGRREQVARELTLCTTGCELHMTCGQPGHGTTVLTLER